MQSSTRSNRILVSVAIVLFSFNAARAFDGSELLIPAGTRLSLQLLSPISTATSKKGDTFSCKVLTPAEYGGSIVEGHVRSVKRSGKADKDSKIDLGFDRVTMPDGSTATFSGTVIEVFDVVNAGDQGRADNEGVVRNQSRTVKTSIKRAAAGALIGALVGGAIAGGQGAAVGAAIGASVGVTTTLATKGPDLEFRTGTTFTVATDGPSKRLTAKTALATTPGMPSSSWRGYAAPLFRLQVPENWQEMSSNPLIFAPAGAYLLNKGRPELTHGVLIGLFDVNSGDLQSASEQFLNAALKSNSYLHREGNSTSSLIGGRAVIVTVLTGTGSQGRPEVVTVYASLLTNGKLFYLLTVVPQVESDAYREPFGRVIGSIEFVN